MTWGHLLIGAAQPVILSGIWTEFDRARWPLKVRLAEVEEEQAKNKKKKAKTVSVFSFINQTYARYGHDESIL